MVVHASMARPWVRRVRKGGAKASPFFLFRENKKTRGLPSLAFSVFRNQLGFELVIVNLAQTFDVRIRRSCRKTATEEVAKCERTDTDQTDM
jgi:hypothetical protein